MINKIYVNTKKFIKENFKELLIFLVIIFLSTYQFPYYIDATGGLINTSERVQIETKKKVSGSFHMAYVNEMPATIPMMFVSMFNKNWDIIPEEEVVAQNETPEEALERGQIYLKSTLSNATLYAYKEAEKKVEVKNEKTVVLYKDNAAVTNLKIGDAIKKVNGVDVLTFEDISAQLDRAGKNVKVELEVETTKGKIKKRNATINSEGKIGIVLQKIFDVTTEPECKFSFKSKETGPSGGLMTTLTIYNYLTDKDITNGLKIAGTGTIENDGTVGEIGGIKYKLAGVVKEEVDLFFVPSGDNYKEAMEEKEKNNYDIEIVGVQTFDEAVNYLETMTIRKQKNKH